MDAEPVTPTAPRPVGRTVFTQRWTDLTFLHWAVPPEQVLPHLPPGTRPDVIDGTTYVGLVPFRMRAVGLLGLPGIPYFGTFPETNVRLYSVDGAGRRGVVFVSLDAARLAPVLVARQVAHLPYLWSRMRIRHEPPTIEYLCRRRWPRPRPGAQPGAQPGSHPGPHPSPHPGPHPGPRHARSRIRIRVGDPVEAGPLEHFLTARWGLHQTDRRGRTAYWPNRHEPWPLQRAEVEELDDELLAAAGFPEQAGRRPDSVLYSAGVHVVFGPRRPA